MVHDIQRLYTRKAYVRFGIAAIDWQPENGYAANRVIMDQLYYYYQQLYLLQPQAFYWMGLARLTGGQVLWGMDNLVRIAKDPCVLTNRIVQAAKDIFENLAWQHELYLDDPEALLHQLQQQDQAHPHTYPYANCWKLIGSNTVAGIAEGNRLLLYNEQFDTIQPHYDIIKTDKYSSRYFWFTRFIMRCIHPAHSRFIWDVPFGDVTNFKERWQWINNETKGMWATWLATPVAEKVRLVSLNNEAVIAHKWGKA